MEVYRHLRASVFRLSNTDARMAEYQKIHAAIRYKKCKDKKVARAIIYSGGYRRDKVSILNYEVG